MNKTMFIQIHYIINYNNKLIKKMGGYQIDCLIKL